jgi:hypothetical protein
MAAVGTSIVFLGLVVLSFVISQIHKILQLWEERDTYLARFRKKVPPAEKEITGGPVYKEHHLPDVSELVSTYGSFIEGVLGPEVHR